MKTHQVLDLTYSQEEGQSCFVGTYSECFDFIVSQYSLGFEITPLLPDEINYYNE